MLSSVVKAPQTNLAQEMDGSPHTMRKEVENNTEKSNTKWLTPFNQSF
jgi:hypothetical protein